MKGGMLYSPFMLKGVKCSYSRAFFYVSGGYIFCKKRRIIVDVLSRCKAYVKEGA